jgi:hypothetical protein
VASRPPASMIMGGFRAATVRQTRHEGRFQRAVTAGRRKEEDLGAGGSPRARRCFGKELGAAAPYRGGGGATVKA